MNYLTIGVLMAGTFFAFTVAMGQLQPAQAQDPCKQNPKGCILVPIEWLNAIRWPWPTPPPPGPGPCLVCGELLTLDKILSLPDNQKFALSVKHGPAVDTVIIEIPKVLSGPLLQNMTMGK